MRTESEVRAAIEGIKKQDARCPVTAHKEGRPCLDVGHAVHGTCIGVLEWVLGERERVL